MSQLFLPDKLYDVAVIGCGPAGLSAAINAKIRNKEVAVFGVNSAHPNYTRPRSSTTTWAFTTLAVLIFGANSFATLKRWGSKNVLVGMIALSLPVIIFRLWSKPIFSKLVQ